jgi:lipopolysaccharide export system permease protein
MIKQLDIYLLRHFFLALIVVVVAIGFTIIVINMVEELRDFIDHSVPLLSILEYYLYFAGWTIKSFFPMFIMLATLFSISLLARKNELLAMKASGISLYRIMLPLVTCAIVLAVAHFNFNEYIFPPANRKRLEIKNFTIEGKSKEVFGRARDIYRQIQPGHFYMIGSLNILRGEGENLRIYKTEKNKLSQLITAERIRYEDYFWRAEEGVVRDFSDSVESAFIEFDTLTILDINEVPDDFANRIGKPEDMSLDQLKQYIDLMKRTGGPYLREAIDLKLKYAYPLTSVIVMMICIPFASNPRRAGVAVSFAGGALITLVYVVLFRIVHSAGYNGKIPEDLSVWGVNGLFFLIGLALIFKARK